FIRYLVDAFCPERRRLGDSARPASSLGFRVRVPDGGHERPSQSRDRYCIFDGSRAPPIHLFAIRQGDRQAGRRHRRVRLVTGGRAAFEKVQRRAPASRGGQAPGANLRRIEKSKRPSSQGQAPSKHLYFWLSCPERIRVIYRYWSGNRASAARKPPGKISAGGFHAALVWEMPMPKRLCTMLAAIAVAYFVHLHLASGTDLAGPLDGQEVKSALIGNTLIGADGEDGVSWVYFPSADVLWGQSPTG